MKQITVIELKTKLDSGESVQIIDVREEYEVEICSIGGEHIPMSEVLTSSQKIKRDIPVIIHCRGGNRAAAVIQALENNFQFNNLYNLQGGIMAWAEQIDPAMETY
jgi:sulfur-carrier protein adenylyltransferase/sulfurtransferase